MAGVARSPKYIATLALVSASILISGSLFKPDRRAHERPMLSETELSRLQRLAQRQALDGMADFFVQVAADSQRSVVWLAQAGRSGIVWAPDLIVTASTEQRFPDSLSLWTPTGGSVNSETVIASPSLPVSALQTLGKASLAVAPRLPVGSIRPGKWIFALWRRESQEHAFAPGSFLGTQQVHCWDSSFEEVITTLPVSEAMAGGGVFDLDGRLVGLVVLCGGRPAVVSADSVQTTLNYGNSFNGRMSTRYGMRVANLAEREREHYGREDGVVVKEIWRGYRGDQAGLLPGDLIARLEGKTVQSVDDLEMLVLPVAREMLELEIVRGGKPFKAEIRARHSESDGRENEAGLRLSAPPAGYPVDFVLSGSPAGEAGIRPGDRLLKLNHQDPRSLKEVKLALAEHREKPLYVVVERGDRVWEVQLQ